MLDNLQLPTELTEKYQTVNETFVNKTGDFETEIGDIKQSDFLPQLKIKRWNNESNFSLRLIDDSAEAPVLATDTNKILWQKSSIEARFYDKGFGEDTGGYEFEVLLKEHPVSNVLSFSIQSKGLDFFYQPPLTDEEIKEGTFRPENVVGSYAVYHSTKKNNSYKTGKAFHIYRPDAIDSKGTRVWCDLNIDDDILTITIPQDFLDTAVYPILVDPTFGYTVAGGSFSTHALDTYVVSIETLSENGKVTKLTASLANDGSNRDVKAAIYDDLANYPNSKKALSAPVTLSSAAQGWIDFPLNANLTPADYWLGVVSGGTNIQFYWDLVTPHKRVFINVGGAYASPAPTFPGGGTAQTDRHNSVYATYDQSLSFPPPNKLRPRMFAPGLAR